MVARIHRRTVQKDLHDPDNLDGVIIHLQPDILEFEVNWALESITTNKASGDDGIPAEVKDDAVKVLHSICQETWKTQQGHRTGKGQFSFQSQIKAMPKNVQTTTNIAFISHASKVMIKILQARFQQNMNRDFQMFKLNFEKAESQRSNCQHPLDHQESKRVPEKHLLLLY